MEDLVLMTRLMRLPRVDLGGECWHEEGEGEMGEEEDDDEEEEEAEKTEASRQLVLPLLICASLDMRWWISPAWNQT